MRVDSEVFSAKQRHNVLVRHRGAEHPRTREAAADLAIAHIKRIIATAPPLTTGQLARLAVLLRPVDAGEGRAA